MRIRRIIRMIALVALVMSCGALLFAWLHGEIRRNKAAIDTSVCQHRLSSIYRAMRYYHDKYGKFPPAFVAGKDGKPMHSWRVLVLETLGEPRSTEVYKAYRFDEPWDGPHNRQLLGKMPDFYACPSDCRGIVDRKPLANYVVIVGPNTVFHGTDSIAMSQVADVHSDTIVIAETLPGIPWMEPRDLEFDKMTYQINDSAKSGISSKDSMGAGIVLMDGRLKRFHKTANPTLIKSMITVNP